MKSRVFLRSPSLATFATVKGLFASPVRAALVLALATTLGACSGGSGGGGSAGSGGTGASGGSGGASGGSAGASGAGGGVCASCDTCLKQNCDAEFQALCGASFPGGFTCPGGPCGDYEQCIIACAQQNNCGCDSCGCADFNCGLSCATSCDSKRTPQCDAANSTFSQCKKANCDAECKSP